MQHLESDRHTTYEIPDGWEYHKIGDLGKIITGSTPSTSRQEYYGNEYLWASPIDLGDVKYVENTQTMISYEGFQIVRKIPAESILVVCIGSTIGKVGIATKEMSTNQQINSIVCNTEYDSEFIYYQLLFNRNKIKNASSQLAVPIINKNDFGDVRLLVPRNKNEQQKIAYVLSKVDELIKKTEQIIEQSKRLKKGLMQKLLIKGIGHTAFKRVSIGEIPKKWGLQQLSAVADLVMGQSPPGDSYNFNGIGTPLLNGPTEFGIEHPFPIQHTTAPTKLSQKGDILLCVRGSTTGRLNLADQEYCLGRGLASVRGLKGKTDTKWLYYQFLRLQNKIYNIASGGGTTFPNINSESIKRLPVPYPQLAEQQKISQILTKIDLDINKQQEVKGKLGHLKNGLMQKLLTGKIRVKV